jgi:hypothetical protein
MFSQVYIKRNYFRDIRAYQPSTLSQSSTNTDGFTRGAAIYIYNYNYGLADRFVSVVTNDSTPNSPGAVVDTTFVNCDNGIAVNNSSVKLYNNFMKDVNDGIRVFSCKARSVQIYTNRMLNPTIGISAIVNPGTRVEATGNYMDVTNNSIGLFPNRYNLTAGIYVADVNSSVKASAYIADNTVLHGRYGIYLLNTGGGAQVEGNHINQRHPTSNYTYFGKQSGIQVENSDGTLVKGNDIKGSGLTYSAVGNKQQRGISLVSTKNYKLGCNITDSIGYGVEFSANCETYKENIVENITRDNAYGWYFQSLAADAATVGVDIGNNGFTTKNIFDGTFNNTGGYKTYNYSLLPSSGGYKPAPFYYYTTSQTLYPDSNTSNYPTLTTVLTPTLAIPSAIVSNECTTDTAYSIGLVANHDDNYQHRVAMDSIDYGDYNSIMRWFEKRHLFNILERNDSLRINDSIYAQFYDTQLTEDVGYFKEYENLLGEITDSLVLEDSIDFESRASTLATKIEAMPHDQNSTSNKRRIAGIYMSFLESGFEDVAEEDTVFLQWLSSSCPYIEGEAVYEARALYSLLNPGWVIDDEEDCQDHSMAKTDGQERNVEQIREKANTENLVSLFPNPATNELNFVYKFRKDEAGTVEVANVMGQKVKTINLPQNQNLITTNNLSLPTGFYICRVTTIMGYSKSITLVISK